LHAAEEAARTRVPLPLCAHTLRAVDAVRNAPRGASLDSTAGRDEEEEDLSLIGKNV
jgi:hypothetical protein